MWLWKKFWNTDIIGKIYILIILFIIIVATITVVTRYKNAESITTNNTNTNEIIKESMVDLDVEDETEIISQNINEEKEDIQIQETPKTTATPTKNTEEKVAVVEKKAEGTKVKEDNQIITEDKKEIIKDTKEEVQEIKQEEQKTEKVEENNNQNINKKEEIKTEIKTETETETKTETKIEEYKKNTDMINKMKSFIQNNPSEDMKTYGFEVIVDSSIVDLTNQFTYTDQRMRNFLSLRFGTIRIYAQDYYYNGYLVMTECFIL